MEKLSWLGEQSSQEGQLVFSGEWSGKTVLKKSYLSKYLKERREQSCVGISRKSIPVGGNWAGCAHVGRTKKGIVWPRAKGKGPEQDREVARARSGGLWLRFEWGEEALRLWWEEGMNWPSYSLYPSSCRYLLMILSTFLYSPIISPKLYFLAPATLNSWLLPNSPLLSTPDFLWLLAPTTINSCHQSDSTYVLLTWVSWHPNSHHQNSWLSPLPNFWHHQSYSPLFSTQPHDFCFLMAPAHCFLCCLSASAILP